MKQSGLKLHHLYAAALLGPEVILLNTLIGVLIAPVQNKLCLRVEDARIDLSLSF